MKKEQEDAIIATYKNSCSFQARTTKGDNQWAYRSTDEQQRKQQIHPFHALDDHVPDEDERDHSWACRSANELQLAPIWLF